MTDLTGQTALITGASRGIGAETARAFAAAGAMRSTTLDMTLPTLLLESKTPGTDIF